MRCRVARKQLVSELDYIKPLFASHHSPCITFQATAPDRLTVRASGVTKLLAGSMEAIVGQAGSAVVGGHPLHSIVGLLDGDEVLLELKGRHLVLQCNDYTAKLAHSMDAVHLPASFEADAVFSQLSDKPDIGSTLTINGQRLLAALKRVDFAAGTTSYVNSVLVEFADDYLGLIATDGHRMAISKEGNHLHVSEANKPVTISTANLLIDVLSDVRKLLTAAKGDVMLFSSPEGVKLTDDRRELFVRLLVMPFPNYQRIIPGPVELSVECGTKELLACCKRVISLADNESARLYLSFEGSDMLVASAGAKERIEVRQLSSPGDRAVTLQGKYLQEALAAVVTERVRFEFGKGPLSIRPVDSKDYKQQIIVMPLK